SLKRLALGFLLAAALSLAATRLLRGHLLALLARLGQAYRDRLLAALDGTALAALAAFQLALLLAVHCALHIFSGAFGIFASHELPPKCLAATIQPGLGSGIRKLWTLVDVGTAMGPTL